MLYYQNHYYHNHFFRYTKKNYDQDDWDDNNDAMDINYGNGYNNGNCKTSQV